MLAGAGGGPNGREGAAARDVEEEEDEAAPAGEGCAARRALSIVGELSAYGSLVTSADAE